MLELECTGLWSVLKKLAAGAESKRAAVAYVSSEAILKFGEGDVLIVNASKAAIAGGQTSAAVLRAAFDRKAKLYSIPSLHTKAYLLGQTAVVGSANISHSSATALTEVALVTDQPEVVSLVYQLIDQLATQATVIDDQFLKEIEAIEVIKKPGPFSATGKKPKVRLRAPRTWILNLHFATFPGDDEKEDEVSSDIQNEVGESEADVDWFFWSRSSPFGKKAKKGDIIIDIYTPTAKTKSTQAVRVYRPAVVRHIRHHPSLGVNTYHCLWPYDSEATSLSWSKFATIAKAAQLGGPIGIHSMRLLTSEQAKRLQGFWP
jgi:hypothetical protein